METGSRAASPIWVKFMQEVLKDSPFQSFTPPPGIVRVSIDAESGLVATDKCEKIMVEEFIAGTQPTKPCDRHQPTGDKFLKVDIDLARQELSFAEATPAQPEPDGFGFD